MSEETAFLHGIRVLEVGEELGEYCGKVLAGLGADVVRVEPPGGSDTRAYGPFLDDVPHPERSLYFWHYNFGKRGVVLDLDTASGQESFRQLAANADIVLDTCGRSYLPERRLGPEHLETLNPHLVYARISPFGDDGPWSDFKGSDLVHLALGGMMMNCGYDPDPTGRYDTPPIAPQMWHSYHIAGEMMAMSIVGALLYRLRSGKGQRLSGSVHEAVSANTETDVPDWVFLRQTHYRVTCRHSMTSATGPSLSATKDGRYLLPYRTYLKGGGGPSPWQGTVDLLRSYDMAKEFEDPKFLDEDYKYTREATDRLAAATDRLSAQLLYERDLWREAQDLGLPWAPVRKPEENLTDEHWLSRESIQTVEHPELHRSFRYVGAKWLAPEVPWRTGPRPPLIGEHTAEVLGEWAGNVSPARRSLPERAQAVRATPVTSKRGKPFAISDVRVLDLSWMLASAGAGRFLSAMGAEVIKVEHESRWDRMRFSLGMCPPGGREQRESATGPIPTPDIVGPNRGGSFMEINAGKLGMSLNLKTEKGRAILEDLIRESDVVVEGFSPGTMERMGFGYERLKELNPRIIYAAQSGFGNHGTYGRARTYGPTAAAFSGISDMSGLPEPFPPAGIGYSYLDWFGAYNLALAMLAALHRRDMTGSGCYIDSSQGETGLYLTGTAFLDADANGRRWMRYGNRSPYRPAAPHGAYRTAGEDRWIGIAAFDESDWKSLVDVLGLGSLSSDPRFSFLGARLAHQDELDALIQDATQRWDGFELMAALQNAGVPAGVCQNAEDRCDSDPQLAHAGWVVELAQSEIGTWPVKEHPVRMSESPAYMGGRFDRSGPSYGEDTRSVLRRILGMTEAQIDDLYENGVL